ncbi:nuclear pore complex protein Nup214-like [Lutzomyia longipalpis]|uniref:nuclear pore complex protein Nup214-like n=1 Tax=Lutzomyia longipalpis TaxID=7200 RepID=UPI002484700F|nr:nuclear pore complex protein Nup214-like [Lutzomyia longipalpis]
MKLEIKRIIEGLSAQKVVNVQRLKRKVGNSWVDTATHVLTFDSPTIPAEMKVGFLTVKTEIYIPSPFRCAVCQKLGHTKKRCNSKQNKPTCGFCAEEYHMYGPCLPPKCVNCRGEHPSSYKLCPKFIEEREINAIRVTMRIPYNLAREELQRRKGTFPSSSPINAPKPTHNSLSSGRSAEKSTFSQIVIRSQQPSTSSSNTLTSTNPNTKMISKSKEKLNVNSVSKPQRQKKITPKAFKKIMAEELSSSQISSYSQSPSQNSNNQNSLSNANITPSTEPNHHQISQNYNSFKNDNNSHNPQDQATGFTGFAETELNLTPPSQITFPLSHPSPIPSSSLSLPHTSDPPDPQYCPSPPDSELDDDMDYSSPSPENKSPGDDSPSHSDSSM